MTEQQSKKASIKFEHAIQSVALLVSALTALFYLVGFRFLNAIAIEIGFARPLGSISWNESVLAGIEVVLSGGLYATVAAGYAVVSFGWLTQSRLTYVPDDATAEQRLASETEAKRWWRGVVSTFIVGTVAVLILLPFLASSAGRSFVEEQRAMVQTDCGACFEYRATDLTVSGLPLLQTDSAIAVMDADGVTVLDISEGLRIRPFDENAEAVEADNDVADAQELEQPLIQAPVSPEADVGDETSAQASSSS